MNEDQRSLDTVTFAQDVCARLQDTVRGGRRPQDIEYLLYQLLPVGFALPPGMYQQWAAFVITRTLWKIGRKDEARAMMLTVTDEGFLLQLQGTCKGMF